MNRLNMPPVPVMPPENAPFSNILLIADIEGSSGCGSYRASSFLTGEWADACLEMTRDVDAVVRALFAAGARQVAVKDFHRTGYNLFPELLDRRAALISGYRRGPVPGIGEAFGVQALMTIGMHAAAGTGGFLAHTFTSRIASLQVSGLPVPELVFFSASLAPYGVRPVFFSGCPEACRQAEAAIGGIAAYPIEKAATDRRFDAAAWRGGLAEAAAGALFNRNTAPHQPEGPFEAKVRMRDGAAAARRLARRWKLETRGDTISVKAADIHELYMAMIRLCYLTPAVERILPLGLFLFDLRGRLGLSWARRRLKAAGRWPEGREWLPG
jgi:D-amino peptidase